MARRSTYAGEECRPGVSVSLAGFFGWLHLHVGSNMSLVYGPVCNYDDVSRNLML